MKLKNELVRRVIGRYSPDKGIQQMEDVMVNEKSYRVYINGKYFQYIYCTPSHLNELVLGHLALKGLISKYEDLKSVDINDTDINITTYSCLIQKANSELPSEEVTCFAEDIVALMKQHLNNSELHKLTGGVHIMSLGAGDTLITSREDIGRHNAVDKLYGYCIKNNVDCSDKIFLSSGRITHEIIEKIINMGIKIVVSRAAVTSLAGEVAKRAGICVMGFARGERFNIYTYPERIFIKNSR